MYISITDSKTADNKGSSGGLVHYLEKENRQYNKQEPEHWFNHQGQQIAPYEVMQKIDNNIAKLSKTDAKFFLVNISPSQKEIRHLIEIFGKQDAREQLKAYAVKVMDEYAKNFNRAGISSSKDLVWFAKLENHRYYTHKDAEVKNGQQKRGDLKQGEQMHIQVIVSRKDATNKIKLSPMNTSRGKNEEHSKKMGQFDRVAFKQCGETLFDDLFEFDRQLKDTLAYANVQKNGNVAQREQLDTLELGAKLSPGKSNIVNELAADVAKGVFQTTTDMLQTVGLTAAKFLDVMLETPYMSAGNSPGEEEIQRKKKKKGQSQDRSMRLK